MRAVDRKLTFWMAGYYDDFIGARAVPDDLNTQGTEWKSSKTHHGNPLNGWANLNPRYTHAWCERGDGASARFNNAATSTADQYKHNGGINEWLAYDQNRRNAGKYEGVAQLQYPDSLTNANRQRFDGGTGILGGSTKAYKSSDAKEAYLLFSHGYNTASRYYSAIGTNDSSFGRAVSYQPDRGNDANGTGAGLYEFAGLPTTATTGTGSLITVPTTYVNTHLASTYMGEVPLTVAAEVSTGVRVRADAYLYPIESPAGKPFLVSEVYTSLTSYTPILSFDGTLNSKGTGDIFTIRMHACAVDVSNARFQLRIGCEGSAFTSNANGTDTGYSRSAITLEITPTAFQLHTDRLYTNPPTLTSLWDDYEFVIDYLSNKYTLYKNGTAVVTNQAMTTKADGTNFTPADMYGWMIEAKSCSKKATVLIDRVGLVRPLNDYPSGIEMPPAVSMAYNTSVNSVSTLSVDVIDDDSQLKLLEFFNASSYADWSLLMFRDNTDRPMWRGSLVSMNYEMDASGRTPTIKLSAEDYFSSLDQQIPTWELGDSGDADSTAIVAYNRSESQNNLNTYYFGASRLISANATLGFNEIDDGSGVFEAHRDSRMRNRSAHPIQMYGDEDLTTGPNTPFSDWDDACDDSKATPSAQYRALHSRWMQDFKNSLWFKHMFGRIQENPSLTTTLASDFEVGDSQIVLAEYESTLSNGGSIEMVDSTGTDAGVVTSIAHSVSTNLVAVDWVANGIGANQTWTQTPIEWWAIIYIAQSAVSSMINHPIEITDCTNTVLNGTWVMGHLHAVDASGNHIANTVTRNGVTCMRFVIYENYSATLTLDPPQVHGWTGRPLSQSVRRGKVYQGNDVYSTSNPTGRLRGSLGTGILGFSVDIRADNDFWSSENLAGGTQEKVNGGTGTCAAPTTNFFQRDHAAGTTVNVRSHTNDFKHVWVMWADMRNDGSADGDAGFRKKNFGLMAPYSQNYSVSMVLADSTVSNNDERQEFVDLSVGEDVDLWEMDATKDPITGNTWSSVNSDDYDPDSFNGSDDARYHNWQDKAGAFIFVDASKFFNLNTESNGGKTGQASGGRKEIGDYLVETEGFPVLIDNYWEKIPTGPYNLDGADSAYWNDNYKKFNSRSTNLLTGIANQDGIIQLVDDIIKIPALVSGQPSYTAFVVGSITSVSQDLIWHFGVHTKMTPVTSMTIAADGNGFCKITGSDAGLSLFRAGQQIVISSSTCTPSMNGTHVIDGTTTHSGSTFELRLAIPANANMTSNGACTVVGAGATYFITTLKSLGAPVAGTTATGQWDGTAYNSPNGAEYLMNNNGSIDGRSSVDIPILEVANTTHYEDATVHVGLANVFPMRLMMQVDGFIENKASYTFNENDKFRVTWLDSLTQNWLTQSALYGTPSIASIPLMNNMTTTQISSADGPLGSIISSSSQTLADGKVLVVGFNTGLGLGLVNGDVVEIVNNSQLSLASDNHITQYTVSNVGENGTYNFKVTKAGASATSNAGYWRKLGTVDDFGSVNDCRNTTIANIFSSTQSGSGIGDNHGTRSVMSWLMGRDSQPSFRPTYGNGMVFNDLNLKISQLSTESGGQISNVRVFYAGGTAFVDYPSATLGQRPRWDIINIESVTSKNEALIVAKQEYEKNKAAPFMITAEIIRFGNSHTMNGLNDTMLYEARYGYVADVSRTIPRSKRTNAANADYTEDKAWAWASLYGGNLFSGIQNGLDSGSSSTSSVKIDNAGAAAAAGKLTVDENYYWYGSNSISYAMQIVHIPQGMPKTTMKTAATNKFNGDGHLRIVIDIDDRQSAFTDPNLAMFRVRLLDYDHGSSTTSTSRMDQASFYDAPVLKSQTSISVSSNGLYQIGIPTTYWPNAGRTGDEKIVISVNHDYLTSLLRNRCGSSNIHKNGNNFSGITYSIGHNTNSIFPLGVRKFGGTTLTGTSINSHDSYDYLNKNAEWYAPRLHIVDDWNFVAGTTVTYNDERLGLEDEKLSIRSISWGISGRTTEQLSISLERDVSRAAKTFASYILPKVPRGGVQSSGQGNQGGGGGGSENGGGGQGSSSDGNTTGGRGGSNAGNPKGGAWKDWGGWGDEGPARTMSADIQKQISNRINGPDGQFASNTGVVKLSSSALGSTTLNRIKGTMDFNNDSVLDGNFGVLGQTKPSAAPRNKSGVSGIDSFISPASGDAFMGEEGMVFSGSVGDNFNAPPTVFVATARIPPNCKSEEVTVSGRVTMGSSVANKIAVLLVTVECVETGDKKTASVDIAKIERGSVNLFSGTIRGASVSTNTIKVSVERNAQTGTDNANFASVTLHNIQIGTDNSSVSGKSQSNSFSYSE